MPHNTDSSGGTARRRRRRHLTWLVVGFVGAAVVLVSLYALACVDRAARAAADGKRALLRAEADLRARNVRAANNDLDDAAAAFARVHRDIHELGPLRAVADATPLVRVQLEAAQTYADTGDLLTSAARNVTDAAAQVVDPPDPDVRLSNALVPLRRIQGALQVGIAQLDAANQRVLALNGKRLFGPLDTTRKQLATELPLAEHRAQQAEQGVDALIDFVGGNGPRRYLIFSQNPDEPRPTGGFIGSYGILAGNAGHVHLERYASIESWYLVHPEAAVPPRDAPTAFQFSTPPVRQTLANVNAVADWPTAARLAGAMWQRGGEENVNGVASITPEFLARVLGVLGAVRVPGYPDVVSASNVIARLDYYTHVEAVAPGANRKQFLVELARVVVKELIAAPARQWDPLGQAVAAGFDAREAMAWSNRPNVQNALVDRHWDGTLPQTNGDFFYDAEFAYATKNGQGLRRVFDHVIAIRPDGSARVTTTVKITDSEPPNPSYNIDTESYLTFYGPTGAQFVGSSRPPNATENDLALHPARGWLASALPLHTTTLTFTWNVPHLLVRGSDGAWQYNLLWMHLAAHTGDRLQLRVDLPAGWRWRADGPTGTYALDRDVAGSWAIVTTGS
jgi:hypothetical protein